MQPIIDNQLNKSQQVLDLLRVHGSGSLSYSALQEGMKWFVREGVGFIQYEPMETVVHNAVCLGDPICAPKDRQFMIEEFIKEFRDPIFIHLSKETAKILEAHDFFINQMGIETVIDIQDFTLTGSKKEFLRSQKNRAQKDKVVVAEIGAEVNPAKINSEDLRHISEAWMQRKAVHDHELTFLIRPAVFKDEPDVRKFVALKNEEVIGFVFFDPMYRQGKIYGYLANILRSLGEHSYSVTDYIIIEALNKFKAEGIEQLSLGFCPFFGIEEETEFRHSKPLEQLYKYSYEHANYLYSFKSLAFHKERYRPDQPGARHVTVYSATKHLLPLLMLHGVFMKMGIKPITQTAEHAAHCVEEMAKGIPAEFQKFVLHWKNRAVPATVDEVAQEGPV